MRRSCLSGTSLSPTPLTPAANPQLSLSLSLSLSLLQGSCPQGDQCILSHNMYESWLHPTRFRTSLCSLGGACDRAICFFAHAVNELRPRDDIVDRIAREVSEK